jgi:hypothetical protein
LAIVEAVRKAAAEDNASYDKAVRNLQPCTGGQVRTQTLSPERLIGDIDKNK